MTINLNDYLANVTIPSYEDMVNGSAQGHVKLRHNDRPVTVMTAGGYMTGTKWESGFSAVSMGALAAVDRYHSLCLSQLYSVLAGEHGFSDDPTALKRIACDLDIFFGMGAVNLEGLNGPKQRGSIYGFSSTFLGNGGDNYILTIDKEKAAAIEVVSSTPRIGNLGKVVGTRFARYFPLIDPESSVREVVAPAELRNVFAAFGRR